MKIRSIVFSLLAFFSMGTFYQVQAQSSATPNVKHRQVKQQKRIVQGVRSGELTKRETLQLQKQQAHIHRTKKRAKADGVVTRKERAVIHHKQNRASNHISRKKRNTRDRN